MCSSAALYKKSCTSEGSPRPRIGGRGGESAAGFLRTVAALHCQGASSASRRKPNSRPGLSALKRPNVRRAALTCHSPFVTPRVRGCRGGPVASHHGPTPKGSHTGARTANSTIPQRGRRWKKSDRRPRAARGDPLSDATLAKEPRVAPGNGKLQRVARISDAAQAKYAAGGVSGVLLLPRVAERDRCSGAGRRCAGRPSHGERVA